jgi:hypothetical protein
VEAPVRQELMSVGCSVEVIEKDGTKTTKASQEGYGHPLILFMLAQLLLGCGGSPLFTLGITYVDDHVPADSSSVYIGKRVDGWIPLYRIVILLIFSDVVAGSVSFFG